MKPASAEAIKSSVAQALDRHMRQRRRDDLLEQIRDNLNRLDEEVVPESDVGPASSLVVADLGLDLLRHEAKRGNDVLDLTPTEFGLLAYMMRSPERAISHQELVREVQGYEAEVWEARELIKYHIYALRQKVEEDPSRPQYIQTVRGIGYKLAMPAEG